MELYLIRHGESIANINQNYDPIIVDAGVELTENGVRQAHDTDAALRKYFNKYGYPDTSSVRVFVSPFMRTRQTYDNISVLHRYKKEEDDLLYEIIAGLFDFFPEDVVKQKFPLQYLAWQTYFKENRYFARYPEGESAADLSVRIRLFIEKILKLEKDGIHTVFIVGHATWIMTFLTVWFHYPPEWFNTVEFLLNCEVIKVTEKETAKYIVMNGQMVDPATDIRNDDSRCCM